MIECPICLENMEEEEFVLMECCNMKFCVTCLIGWFNSNASPTCPICHNILDDYYIPIADEAIIDNSELVSQNYNKIFILISSIILFIFIRFAYF